MPSLSSMLKWTEVASHFSGGIRQREIGLWELYWILCDVSKSGRRPKAYSYGNILLKIIKFLYTTKYTTEP